MNAIRLHFPDFSEDLPTPVQYIVAGGAFDVTT
jgi:hypothetical protein